MFYFRNGCKQSSQQIFVMQPQETHCNMGRVGLVTVGYVDEL